MSGTLRKPLYDREKDAPPTQVCVTGATGYIAANIIQRLLAAGHTVHATVRDPVAAPTRAAYLLTLPGAEKRLKFFQADLLTPGSFDDAVAGCKWVVHTASPVVMVAKPGEGRKRIVEPARAGVDNVLASVNRTETVQRVLITSSVAAVVGVHSERGAGHVFTEADWDLSASPSYLPYHFSKVVAEQRAMEMCAAQNRWSLVTIQPAIVQGPPLGNLKCESVGFLRKLMNGKYWPAIVDAGFGLVDVDDVAAAHCLALVTPSASGRYLCVAESLSLMQYVDLLRPTLGSRYKLPAFAVPQTAVWLLSKLVHRPELDLLLATAGPPPQFDCSRIRRDLGLEFMRPEQTALDMAQRLEELGIVKPCR